MTQFSVMKEGHIFTDEVIGDDYHQVLKAQIQNLPSDITKIIHHISSPGGSVYGGYKGYHVLKATGKPIKSIIEGEAQSMATFVALAGEEIVILSPSIVMIHNPSQGIRGDADMLQGGAEELRKIENEMAQAYADRMKISVDEVKVMMKKETRWDAKEAVSAGFANALVSERMREEEYQKLKAVAFGKKMEGKDISQLIEDGFSKIEGLFKKKATAESPKALDVPMKDGKVLVIQTEDGDLMGKAATVDGAPAPDGSHELADGRVIVTVGGLVTEVKEAETEAQRLAKENEALKAQVAQINAAKAATEAAKVAAETQASETATMLATVKEEVQKVKSQILGDPNGPNTGLEPNRFPTAMNKTTPDKMAIMATRSWMADNMPHMERHYKNGKFSDGTDFLSYRSEGPNAVSILETQFSYTWNGLLSLDLFFKPTLSSPALSDLATIDTGAKDKKRYHFAPTFSNVLKPYTGCDQAVTGSSFVITDKLIQLKPFQMYEGFCKDDFTDQLTGSFNVLAQEWLKSGNESFDPAGTPIDRIIIEGLKDALRRDVFRRVSFADISSSSANYNQFDGYWPNLIDQSGASNYCVYRYGAALGTGTLASGTANTYFQGLYENSSLLLKEQGIDMDKAKFMVTRSIWENYYTYLVGVGAVTEQAYSDYKKGLKTLEYRGIPVIPVTIWDSFLAEPTNPLFAITRHLISFTMKENHVIGIENTPDLDKIDSWFEKKDNKRYYRSNMTMGFLGALHCDLTSISY